MFDLFIKNGNILNGRIVVKGGVYGNCRQGKLLLQKND